METIHQLVGMIIVASKEDLDLVILWNHSATLNLYHVSDGVWDALDVKTLGDTDRNGRVSYDDARACAEQWLERLEIGES